MSTLLKASVPAEQFALSETFEAVPEVEFDAVRFVCNGTGRMVPLLWMSSADTSHVEEMMQADTSTEEVSLVSQRNHDALFRMEWTDNVGRLTHVLVNDSGAIVSAHGSNDTWTFRVLFPERDGVSATCDACENYDITIDQIYTLGEEPSLGGFHLTDEQFTTVRNALDSGYYAVPRETTLEELATELGVSHQALSERLRRGHRTLIETVITA